MTDAGAYEAQTQPLAIYIHWPFCLSKCPYCDFNSHVRDSVNHKTWKKALLDELEHYANFTRERLVTSVFFGGGTPSLMEPGTVEALLGTIHDTWKTAPNLEITLEANPTSSEIEKFAAFKSAGVNRVSLGVQAMDDTVLKFLGRTHSAKHALEAVGMAAKIFDRYSFDLIYARPGQTLKQWEQELRAALTHAGDHLSLYQLTIEPGTQFFHAHASGNLREIEEDTAAELFLLTQAIMEEAGMPAYEISNHARPGGESRHNLTYWRYGDYLGVGPGAHGRITRDGQKFSTQAVRSPEKWLQHMEQNLHGIETQTALSVSEQEQERFLMGMRLREGIDRGAIAHMLDEQVLERYIKEGWIEADANRLRATTQGFLRLNSLLGGLLKTGV